ncbi:MAG: O-acetylserine/cysteine efflux transporter [Polaribacter sp.]|jgi:O-acetylserine/cysteine efflux transporter
MKLVDILAAIAVASIWGMGFIVAKSGMSHFSPILLMALRFTLTAVCLMWFFRPPLNLLKDLFWISLVSAAIQYSLTFTGVQGLDASTAALLVQLEVPFGLLLAYIFLGERVTLKQGIGILVAFVGVALILKEPKLSGSFVSALMVIGGAFTWAVGQIMIKKMATVGGFMLISGIAIFATPQLFIASYLFESNQITQIQSAGWPAWSAVIYLGLIMTALGYGMWYRLLGLYSINQVMPFLLLLPVVAVIGGVLFLDEILTTKVVIGGILALSGVALISIQYGAKNPKVGL